MAGNTDVNLPSPLVNILSSLESQYSTLSWQIYGSDSGATVRIRFGEFRHARRHCSQAEFSNASETTSCPQTIIKYKKNFRKNR